MKILAKKNMAKSLYEDISKMVAKEFLVFNSHRNINLHSYLCMKILSGELRISGEGLQHLSETQK